MGTASHEVIDLTRRREVTYRLLDDTWGWRERLVETFEFASTHYVRVRSSYQVRLTPELLSGNLLRTADAVRLLLPVTTRPKRALVGFDLEVDDMRAHLPLRRTLADIQSGYLELLLSRSETGPQLAGRLPPGVLRAVCAFTPGLATGFRGLDTATRLTKYLRSLLHCEIDIDQVRWWLSCLRPVATLLADTLAEPPDRLSAAENILLAVPFAEPKPSSAQEIDAFVQGYLHVVLTAGEQGDAGDFLEVLAEYGRRWELIAEAVVPIDRPCLVKVHEDRPLGLKLHGRCRQRLWLGDAASYHMEARAFDPAVTFSRRTKGRDAMGRKAGFGIWEGRGITRDAISLYTSDRSRPYLVDLTMHLRVASAVRLPTFVVQTLALIAIVITARLDLGDRDRVGTLALLVVPMSLIVAFLVVREHTSLASRLQRASRLVLLAELAVLWIVAIHRLVTG